MPKHIYKKNKRSRRDIKLKITPTDKQIIQQVADFRLLDTKLIAALHPEISTRGLQRRLQKLFHAGFLDRPAHQFAYFKPSGCLVYALGREGAKMAYADRRHSVNWSEKNRQIQPNFMEHCLMVSRFGVALMLAMAKKQESSLSAWQKEGTVDYVFVNGRKIPLRPDAFFTLEDKGDLLHFFLEADRSSMTLDRFARKIQAYWQWWRGNRQEKLLGISRFRVLTITISEARRDHLRQISRQADPRGQGSEMFLFACHKDYRPESAGTILESIWKSPKNDKPHHLLE